MTRTSAARWAAGLGLCLTWTAGAGAGPVVDLMQPCDCPPTHYSALHVLTPELYRLNAWSRWWHGQAYWIYPPNYHPEIPLHYHPIHYHCPSVNPLKFSIDHYPGLVAPPPCSCYHSPADESASKDGKSADKSAEDRKKPPEEERLPPPKPDK
jgi:hypothetical protein